MIPNQHLMPLFIQRFYALIRKLYYFAFLEFWGQGV